MGRGSRAVPCRRFGLLLRVVLGRLALVVADVLPVLLGEQL